MYGPSLMKDKSLFFVCLFFFPMTQKTESESCSVVPDSLQSHGLYSPWNSSGQNTGVGSLPLLQGIFSTQGLNPGLPNCRWTLYQLSHKGSPRILEWVAYPFPMTQKNTCKANLWKGSRGSFYYQSSIHTLIMTPDYGHNNEWGDFVSGLVVKNPLSNAGDMGLIPGGGIEIPHAVGVAGSTHNNY